ncbi:hypothetical protein [Corynebacterium sp.]|uniref:hypothetical protein n=1 Tax=Corynebacterium sp. TaxID=1720 RepID=UPI0028A806B6|nr:hypothetical protein [Corynebacterium sp.]
MAKQPPNERKLQPQQKRIIRYSYEVLTGQYDPPWVAEAPEAVQQAYLAGKEMALTEIITAMYSGSKRFTPEVWKRELFEYHRKMKDTQ